MVETNLPNAGAFTVEDLNDVNAVLNKLSITAGKVLTVDNSLELAGTDGTKMTFPTTSATIARTDAANTFTGTQTFTGAVAATGAVSGLNVPVTVLCGTEFDATSGGTGVTLTNVIGLVQTVVVGTYKFKLRLSTVATANTGFKCGFKLTTAVLSAIDSVGTGMVAAASATTHTTTTTDQTLLFDSAAGVELGVIAEGIMVFSTGGTIGIQAAQHSSHADTVSVLVNSFFEMTRIA